MLKGSERFASPTAAPVKYIKSIMWAVSITFLMK